jgi:hypothetical protein
VRREQVLLVLALELLDEVVDEMVIKVLTAQVSVTGSGLDLEDTVLNGEEYMLFVVLRVMEGSLPWLHSSPKSCRHGSRDWCVSAAMMGHGGAWKGWAGSWMPHLG